MGLEPVRPWRVLPYHGAELLSTGRSCMARILDLEQPARVHVPFFTCDCLLTPMLERGIEVSYYRVNDDLLPETMPTPGERELVVLIDYFGVRTHAVRDRAIAIGPQAVIDSTHAFFSGAPPAGHHGFNSARKFRGVPDGAFLFLKDTHPAGPLRPCTTVHADHLVLRALGSGPEVAEANRMNEARLSTAMIGASILTRHLLHRLDHEEARAARNRNFHAAHEALSSMNLLRLNDTAMDGPLCYPLLMPHAVDLKPIHGAGIFAARYWPDVLVRAGGTEFPEDVARTKRLIAFPIDQRYSAEQTQERAWQMARML